MVLSPTRIDDGSRVGALTRFSSMRTFEVYITGGIVSEVGITRARQHFRELIRRVEAGEEVVLVRRGKKVARLVPPIRPKRKLPSLREFRASVQVDAPISEAIVAARAAERY